MTWLQGITLGVAVLGLVTAAGSLTWNVVMFRLQGARVEVSSVVGLHSDFAGVLVEPVGTDGIAIVRRQLEHGDAAPLIGVRVFNGGRSATQLSDMWLEIEPSGAKHVGVPRRAGPELPCELPPGAQFHLMIHADLARSLVEVIGDRSGTEQTASLVVTAGGAQLRGEPITRAALRALIVGPPIEQ